MRDKSILVIPAAAPTRSGGRRPVRTAFLALGALALASSASALSVYPHRMDPRRHPDDARRAVKPPSWDSFGRKTQFIAYRGMNPAEMDRVCVKGGMGDILWPPINSLFNGSFETNVLAAKARGLYVFDPWGFVPGCGAGGPWRQYDIPKERFAFLERELGDRWLGMDNGEQDGRYAGGYAFTQIPLGNDRFHQYLNFQRHFERLDEMLGNRMATLVSLNFGHYFLRENCYTLIGAETAQALPNAQIYYSWIRGAGKQYGVPWFGNVSAFNRWGWKAYPQEVKPHDPAQTGCSPGNCGLPTNGTSLALLKKLFYAQIFYNSLACGFEMSLYWSGRYTKDGRTELSPIGRIHKDAVDWCARHGDVGVMHAPVAVMTDFYAGWTYPRHLYSGRSYLVWGALPYDDGDHLTDGVLDLLYPGYCDASYFRDERGFNVDTPYGDIADCLLSDAPVWVLKQYPAIVLTGRLRAGAELRDNLLAYVRDGGELCLTAGNAKTLFPEGLAKIDAGKGRFTPLPGGDFGIETKAQCALPVVNKVEVPLSRPHPLAAETRAALAEVFARQAAFTTSADFSTNGLSVVSCRRGKGEWTVLVLNNTWQERPLRLFSHVGRIAACEDVSPASPERTAAGFAPDGRTDFEIGRDTERTIAAGGVRIFRVRTEEGDAVRELPAAEPPANLSNAVLALRGAEPIKEQILRRPTFFRHYGGVMVDWTYLRDRDPKALEAERNWLGLQQVRILVDMSSGFNLFPDLRLCDNDPKETARTDAAVKDVLGKMRLLGAKTLILAPNRSPETNMTHADAVKNAKARLAVYADWAAKEGVTLHVRNSPRRQIASPGAFSDWSCGGRVKPAVSLAAAAEWCDGKPNLVRYVLKPGEPKYDVTGRAPVYLLAAPGRDENGQIYSYHRPIREGGADFETYLRVVREKKDAIVVFDALYADVDAEYADVRYWRGL